MELVIFQGTPKCTASTAKTVRSNSMQTPKSWKIHENQVANLSSSNFFPTPHFPENSGDFERTQKTGRWEPGVFFLEKNMTRFFKNDSKKLLFFAKIRYVHLKGGSICRFSELRNLKILDFLAEELKNIGGFAYFGQRA